MKFRTPRSGCDCGALAKPPTLVSIHEIKVMLGVSRQRVYQLSRLDDFPRPFAELACGRVWLEDDIASWLQANRGGDAA